MRRFDPQLDTDLMQTVTLLTSELVANAVMHADATEIELLYSLSPSQVRVQVVNAGNHFTPQASPPNPGRAGGWGLYMVDELASRWGVLEGPGTRVWFEIDR